jgi:uncharacterized damage-inducible protein DinB
MKMTEWFLAQIEREAKGTRSALERVPEGKNDWKPHAKSMALGYLSVLVATMPSWLPMIIEGDELDIGSGAGAPKAVDTNQELLAIFDRSLDAARQALASTTDERLMGNWRLLFNGRVVDDRPRHLIIADTMCHLAHHRGQLTVYLRLNDKPVPAIYGASADERW